jgi:hypothetical protein
MVAEVVVAGDLVAVTLVASELVALLQAAAANDSTTSRAVVRALI